MEVLYQCSLNLRSILNMVAFINFTKKEYISIHFIIVTFEFGISGIDLSIK